MAGPRIPLPHEALAAFCRRHGIRSLSLFGSVLRDDFTETSDVDVLIEFESGRTVGYLRFASLEDELSQILGRKVDLKTAAMLSPYFRDEVLREASPAYDAA